MTDHADRYLVEKTMQIALISALTAAVITLFIEFTAKPRLEVRKDRILEFANLHRDTGALLAGLDVKLTLLEKKLEADVPLECLRGDVFEVDKLIMQISDNITKLTPGVTERPLVEGEPTGRIARIVVESSRLTTLVDMGLADGGEQKYLLVGVKNIATEIERMITLIRTNPRQFNRYRKCSLKRHQKDGCSILNE
ncbi:hypothetical protein AB0F52_44190 [Amycolatopsis sp. NPDC024027]|uniref:hypothetical protein n=1 Tax=Amycolatopsis sp. NPDC024027 TaxID=3154327 RepID=UPI0034064EDB